MALVAEHNIFFFSKNCTQHLAFVQNYTFRTTQQKLNRPN